MYVFHYWFCEFLCFVNIVVQLYLMNSFFDGEFMSYGLKVLSFSEESQVNIKSVIILEFNPTSVVLIVEIDFAVAK